MLAVLCWVTIAGAVPFDVKSEAWDGLSAVATMARRVGVRVEAGRATANDDALLVLFPSTRVDAVALAGNRPNMRVAVFDDFGGELSRGEMSDGSRSGNPAGSSNLASGGVRADLYWRGIRDLPVARARRAHPTTTGVRDVVMNRPAPESSRRSWQSASAILEFAAGSPAVVASANLVLGADPSLFINRMLAFGDNRRFAENLLRWLSLDGRVPVRLVVGDRARGIALLHRPGGSTSWLRPIGEALTDVNLNLGRRAEPVAAAEWGLGVLVFALAMVVASRWVRSRWDAAVVGGTDSVRRASQGRLTAEIEDAWFDLGVRLQNVRVAEWTKRGRRDRGDDGRPLVRIPSGRPIGQRIGASAARVEAAHAVLDELEKLPRVERLLPPPVGVASRQAGVERR